MLLCLQYSIYHLSIQLEAQTVYTCQYLCHLDASHRYLTTLILPHTFTTLELTQRALAVRASSTTSCGKLWLGSALPRASAERACAVIRAGRLRLGTAGTTAAVRALLSLVV